MFAIFIASNSLHFSKLNITIYQTSTNVDTETNNEEDRDDDHNEDNGFIIFKSEQKFSVCKATTSACNVFYLSVNDPCIYENYVCSRERKA